MRHRILTGSCAAAMLARCRRRLALLLAAAPVFAILVAHTSLAAAHHEVLSHTSAGSTPKCEPIDLGIHYVGSSLGGPMDQSKFQFINVTHRACHLRGYPGAAADNAAGRAYKLKVKRENFDDQPIRYVALAPHGRASFVVQSTVPGFQHGHCVTSVRMRFTPPNDYSTLSIRRKLMFCDGEILIGAVERSG